MAEYFQEYLEQDADAFPSEHENLTGDKRTEARLCAIQAIFQARLNDEPLKDVQAEFERSRLKVREADKKVFKEIIEALRDELPRYEELLSAHMAENWKFERVDSALQALLFAAVGELSGRPSTPTKVIISEFIDISKAFGNKAEDAAFVNAVLDAVAKKVRGA